MLAGRIKVIAKSPVFIRILSVAVSFLSSILINRSLGVDLRGEYATITVYASLIQSIANLGLALSYSPLVKRYGELRAKRGVLTLIWCQFFLYSIVVAVLCLQVAEFEVVQIFLLSLFMILNGQIVFAALLDNIDRRNRILLISSIGFFLANGVIYILAPRNLLAVMTALIAKNIFETIACSRMSGLFKLCVSDIDFQFIRCALRYGLPAAMLALLIQCNYNIDIVIMNLCNSSEYEIGLLGTAYTLSNMLWVVPDAFKELIYHRSAKAIDHAGTISALVWNMLFGAAICIVFLFSGRWLLGLLYGVDYVAAFSATMIMFIGIIPMIAFKLIHPIYVNSGKSIRVAVMLAISVSINIPLAVFLIPLYGAAGASLATVISYSVCGLLFFVMYMHDARLSPKDALSGLKRG